MKSEPIRPRLRDRLWFRIFVNVGILFFAFVLILAVTDSTLLAPFYTARQRKTLAAQLDTIAALDLEDETAVTGTLSKISDRYNYEIEIYDGTGKIRYTTYGNQMMDYFTNGRENFAMLHENLQELERRELPGGTVFAHAVRRLDQHEYLLCFRRIGRDVFAEVRVQKQLVDASAATANEFILIVAGSCFLLSIVWVLIFARRFSKPIAHMNEITRDLSNLDFSRKVEVTGEDELGQLARSINEMSDSLCAALGELRESNAKLRDEIELERQLDGMRKGFVANVSHELKTPISIISGYAEGLKLNVNSEAREEYCNIIIDESNRMNRLVLSILELSRYESGMTEPDCRAFELFPLCEESLRRIFADGGVTVRNEIPEQVQIHADPVQTEQVLKAFLENAKAHTPPGGTVTVSATEHGDCRRLSVENSGSHIDEEIMPHIWQSFYRGETSHKRENTRFGLGLSIVRAIASLHGTDCGVYNTENGVCFWCDFKAGGT